MPDKQKLSSRIQRREPMARAVPLCFLLQAGAQSGTAPMGLYPHPPNGGWTGALTLQNGFQIAAPGGFSACASPRLAPFPRSLLPHPGVLVPIIAFEDGLYFSTKIVTACRQTCFNGSDEHRQSRYVPLGYRTNASVQHKAAFDVHFIILL